MDSMLKRKFLQIGNLRMSAAFTWNNKHVSPHSAPLHVTVPYLRTGCPNVHSHASPFLTGNGRKGPAYSHTLTLKVVIRHIQQVEALGITDPTIRVEIHNRVTLAGGLQHTAAYAQAYPPVCTFSLSHAEFATKLSRTGEDLVVQGIDVPLSIPPGLAPDAMISVQYLATKNPEDHLLEANAALLYPDPGRDLLFGFTYFALADLASGKSYKGTVYPLGIEEDDKRIRYHADDAIATVHARLSGPFGVLGPRFMTAESGYLNVLTDSKEIRAIVSTNEEEMIRGLMALGASSRVPDAIHCWEHRLLTPVRSVAGQDGFEINGFYFNMLPHPRSPLYPSSEVTQALVHMALLARHIKFPEFLQPMAIADSEVALRLQTAPHLISRTAMMDLEWKRLSGMAQAGAASIHDDLMDLALMAGACLIRHGTYSPDEALSMRSLKELTRHKRKRRLPRPQMVQSDFYTGWEHSDRGFSADCEDRQAGVLMVLAYFRHALPEFVEVHPLCAAICRAVQGYLVLTAGGTARCSHPGAVQTTDAGMEGHIFGIVVPLQRLAQLGKHVEAAFLGVPQRHSLHGIGEGTCAQDARNRRDPNPRPMRKLVKAMQHRANNMLDVLGLTTNSTWGFAAANPDDEFYDGVCTAFGPALLEIEDPSPRGHGRKITSVAVTMQEGDHRRVGVPMSVFLDPEACDRAVVELTPVSWETEENLERLTSVNMLMPARIVPTPHLLPGVNTGIEHIPEHLHILHRSSSDRQRVFVERRASYAPRVPTTLVFNIRLDRTNAIWAMAFYECMAALDVVGSLDVYVEDIFAGLRGACVVVGVFV